MDSNDLFAMGGTGHVALMASLFGFLALLILFKKDLWRLRQSRAFMAGTSAFVLVVELATYALKFVHPTEPVAERLPLHLCASLKIAIAAFILLERYDLVKYVSIWAIGSGFISFANLNLEGQGFADFSFWQYLWGHYYLFLVPVLLFLTGEFRYDLRYHARSLLGLFVWSLVIFCVNWAFGSNYMYMGPHNHTAVPFIPDRFMVWPLNYVSYVLVGMILLNAIYALLRFSQGRMDRRAAGSAAPAPLGA